ncbi:MULTISPECIES: thiol-activated cytolysin family protein [unclassified Tenacibaculum]|uniref:thiol-activated cytolysin family protein n=1 Tax=unclassified Tenacibaculum TaxID=2635139 RepID=UPI001F1D12D7|nr:thiol-activated cytolysin family protein [Tenacibaculum sp. Cn5-34]MCF2875096.1 thiol-activated cytolysin family protein [Tenacibaculum sp. Cn5-1]MCF2935172.1 thiol-activated cytolysin family protein [Tenacibaculum sp. Cn5-34]MCG7511386.1 thiol-activated cytolysin family protein [Tenacibaculum sp. Cn5-46]
MKKYIRYTILSLCLAMVVSCKNDEVLVEKNLELSKGQFLNENIPDGISNLEVKEIKNNLASRSEVEANCVEKEVSFDKTDSNFFLINPNGSLLWPGNIVALRSIQNGAPTSVPFYGEDRNSIEIGLDVISGTAASTSTVVGSPSPGTVRNELNRILGNYYDSGASFPAAFEVSIERVHNASDLQFALKAGYSGYGVDVAGELGINFNEQKTRYVVTLKQRFFTATVTPKAELIGKRGWYNSNVTPNDLAPYVTDFKSEVSNVDMNPAGYVESVTYGRLFTLIYESSESARNVSAALNFAYKGAIGSVTADVSTKYSQTLQNTTVKVKQIGGDAQPGITAGLRAMAGDLNAINAFLEKGANVSRTNPGYPISYKVNYVSNNSPFKVVSNVKYTQRNCELVTRRRVRFNPTAVLLDYYSYDHNTSGLEIQGWFKVQKYDRDLNQWYDVVSSFWWGYGVEHTQRDYYKYSNSYSILGGSRFVDFDIDEINGERFRVVSTARECDATCTVLPNGGVAPVFYEYSAASKTWTGHGGRPGASNTILDALDWNRQHVFVNKVDGSTLNIFYNIYFLD